MTGSTHVYSAVLVGSPDVALSVKGGSITLDTSRAPHVQADLTIAMPSLTVFDALDPRRSPRVRITAAAGGVTRTFDLGVRDREEPQQSGDVPLTLASDEAVLMDYRALADDNAPFDLADSLRSVVNYVLGKVIPGAVLAASPAGDASLTPFWRMSNLCHNPAVQVVLNGWYAASGNTGLTRDANGGPFGRPSRMLAKANAAGAVGAQWTGAASGGLAFTQSTRPGEWYTASAYFVGPSGKGVRAFLRFTNGVNYLDVPGTVVTASSPGWVQRVSVTAQCPPGYSGVSFYVLGYNLAVNQVLYLAAGMLTTGKRLIPWFDGATANDANYIYTADGNAHASPSTRTPYPVERDPDALTWKAGQSGWEFLVPLFQAAGYRLVCDEASVWTLRPASYIADGVIDVRYGANLIDGTSRISRDDAEWFDAATRIYRWTDRDGIQQERVDAYALTAPSTKVDTLVIDAPYPGPGRAKYAVERAQGRGRQVTVTSVSDWRARAEMSTAIKLAAGPIQTGKAQAVRFDLDTDRMTVTDRTTDTDAHAWILQGAGAWKNAPTGAWKDAA